LQGEVEPTSEKEPEGWSAPDKFTVVLERAGLNTTELSAYCRVRGLFPEQVSRWRQAAQDANAKPVPLNIIASTRRNVIPMSLCPKANQTGVDTDPTNSHAV